MDVKYIILHCSDTEDGPTLSWPAIRRYHVEQKGWQDIGYHFGIEWYEDGIVLLPGRPVWMQGAHCLAGGRNLDSLGVCVVGKFETGIPPSIYAAAIDGLSLIAFAHGVPPEHIRGHREYEGNKTCPGMAWNLDDVRHRVANRLRDGHAIGRHLRLDLSRFA